MFGSITQPYRFGRRSDIDIATNGAPAKLQVTLASAIERDFGRDVDIVALEECRFSHWILQEGLWWKRRHQQVNHLHRSRRRLLRSTLA